jgi:hypothetical protein
MRLVLNRYASLQTINNFYTFLYRQITELCIGDLSNFLWIHASHAFKNECEIFGSGASNSTFGELHMRYLRLSDERNSRSPQGTYVQR